MDSKVSVCSELEAYEIWMDGKKVWSGNDWNRAIQLISVYRKIFMADIRLTIIRLD